MRQKQYTTWIGESSNKMFEYFVRQMMVKKIKFKPRWIQWVRVRVAAKGHGRHGDKPQMDAGCLQMVAFPMGESRTPLWFVNVNDYQPSNHWHLIRNRFSDLFQVHGDLDLTNEEIYIKEYDNLWELWVWKSEELMLMSLYRSQPMCIYLQRGTS